MQKYIHKPIFYSELKKDILLEWYKEFYHIVNAIKSSKCNFNEDLLEICISMAT